jgi:hypothetical protein
VLKVEPRTVLVRAHLIRSINETPNVNDVVRYNLQLGVAKGNETCVVQTSSLTLFRATPTVWQTNLASI